ncbi:unnamed protein product [Allacma fusca]|uniref:Alpha-carbonic anhydrase domain-containing protein n=1 Tax=Allacma fusca TaxID=39272 RepID=A0A8J2L1M1_9HEXA|nr:unnamed protein product [Allacma fusca]
MGTFPTKKLGSNISQSKMRAEKIENHNSSPGNPIIMSKLTAVQTLAFLIISVTFIATSARRSDDSDDDVIDDPPPQQQGIKDEGDENPPGSETHEGGCLEERHAPFNMPTGEFLEKENSGDEVEEIRINKFYSVYRDRFYIRNTGSSLEFQVKPDIELVPEMNDNIPDVDKLSEPRIRGPDWDDEYVLAKGYFHWQLKNLTVKNSDGTTVFNTNSTAPPLEMELVHYAKKYDSLEKAAKQADGIIVTAHLFELVGRDNPALEPIARSALSVSFPSTKFKQVHGPLDLKLLFPSELSYCEFNGLYPLNPCANNARFFLFKKPMFVSARQLKRFGGLRSEDGQKISDKLTPEGNSRSVVVEADNDDDPDAPPPFSKTASGKCSTKTLYLTIVDQNSLSKADWMKSSIPKSWEQAYVTTIFSVLTLKVILLSFKCHIYFIL